MPPQTTNSQFLLSLSTDLTIAFLSILAFQTILIYRQWRTFRTREYKTYIIYLTITFLYFSVLWSWALQPCKYDVFIDFVSFYFKRPIAFLIYYCYYNFVVDFLDFKLIAPKVYYAIAVLKKALLAVTLFFLTANLYLSSNIQTYIYITASLLLFIISIYFIVVLWRTKTRFVTYFLKGSACALSGAFISNIMFFFYSSDTQFNGFHFINCVAPLAGVLIEVSYFTSGLSFKSKLIEIEKNEQKDKLLNQLLKNQELTKETENIKDKIAQDLHDDVGATLSSMQLYGELANNQWDKSPMKSKEILYKITNQSKDLITRMSDIIWSLKPIADTHSIDMLFKNYSVELLIPKNIICSFKIDEKIHPLITDVETRRNILLITKEAMNNIAKYSQASNATVSLLMDKDLIILSITDNGKGFDTNNYIAGNGLSNINKRAIMLKAIVTINSSIGNGTSIVCKIPF